MPGFRITCPLIALILTATFSVGVSSTCHAQLLIDRIKEQAKKNGLKFPIAVHNDGANWNAWSNRVWPTVYVVDKRGTVRYGWEGELSYKGAPGEENVRKLVDELLLERP
jgi:hypothetical protein